MDSGRLDMVPTGTVNLDTVRALHQTVVSLRTALEVSKNELKALKEKYKEHSCVEYEDVIEKLTLENHILRRKIIDSGGEKDLNQQNIQLEVTYSPKTDVEGSDIIIKTATENIESEREVPEQSHLVQEFDSTSEEGNNYSSAVNNAQASESQTVTPDITPRDEAHNTEQDYSQITSLPQQEEEKQPSFKTKLELLSKFDVRIKVRTLTDGGAPSTSDSDSTEEKKDTELDFKPNLHFKEKRKHFEDFEDPKGNKIHFQTVSSENIKMAVPNEGDVKSKTDKFDVQVRITSEENLVVKDNVERNRRKDTLNLDVDDLSLRSLSEGDNSVFSEGGTTPADARTGAGEDKMEQEASGNESEEVDDIELIFTTDESKDMSNLQVFVSLLTVNKVVFVVDVI
ncbi:hypothetical protein O3G_MSEX005100 [Manduca sexta]|uniref:Uncharacterized protein n=1 Tax=Manduca sexta TaxID=7130 RepID=A0A921YXI8_MANSE|nr:hypothetical protein O3G_MSEX005100 [Manduca sexta]